LSDSDGLQSRWHGRYCREAQVDLEEAQAVLGALTRQLAAGRVDLYKAAVEWVKLAPDGTYTKNRLARELAQQYDEDEVELRKIIKRLVDCGALLWQDDPHRRRMRRHLFRGHCDASRARVRAQTVHTVTGTS
jgi:RNase P subunit RPR2